MTEGCKQGRRDRRAGVLGGNGGFTRPPGRLRGVGLPVAAGLMGLMVLTGAAPVLAAPASHGQGDAQAAQQAQFARIIVRKGEWVEVDDEPLLGVIDELNRRSERKLKVDRGDPRLRNLKVTGRFRIDRPETLVQYIRSAGIPVWITKDGNGNIVLRLRGEPSSS